MGKKRLIEVGVLIGCGLFFLALGLYVYWTDYFNRCRFFSYSFQGTDIFTTQVFAGVFILSGSVITILGGLTAFRVKVSWWRIASVLLFVSLFLPWWQWGFRRFSLGTPEERRGTVTANNFLFGFLAGKSFPLPDPFSLRHFQFTWDICFIPYLTLESAAYFWQFGNILIGSWSDVLLVRVLCCVIFGMVLSTSVLGWSNRKKRRLIGVVTGCAGIVLFMAWLFLAWSVFGLGERFYSYFLLDPWRHSFLSFGFFATVVGVIILAVSLFMKDVEKTLNLHLAS